MTSEDSKQADQVATSPDGQEPKGKGDDLAADSTAENAKEPNGPSGTEDRWNDSDIDAAVGVLERPSQIPPSVRGLAAPVGDADEHATLLERHSVRLSASAVEKSKRTGSEPPNTVASMPPSQPASAGKSGDEIAEAQEVRATEPSPQAVDAEPRSNAGNALGAKSSPRVPRPEAKAPSPQAVDAEPRSNADNALGAKSSPRVPRPEVKPPSRRVADTQPGPNVDHASSGEDSFPRVPRLDVKPLSPRPAEAETSSNAGTRPVADSQVEIEEPTRFFERPDVAALKAEQPINVPKSGGATTDASESAEAPPVEEEPTRFFERPDVAALKAEQPADGEKTGKGLTDASESADAPPPVEEEPTTFFARPDIAALRAEQPADGAKTGKGLTDASESAEAPPPVEEEPTTFFVRPDIEALKKAGQPSDTAKPGAGTTNTSDAAVVLGAIGRESSLPLAMGVALLSAETTDPPPVVARGDTLQSGSPRPKVSPPRPAAPRPLAGSARAELDKAPLSVPTGDVPTRHEGKSKSPQADPAVESGILANAVAQPSGSNPAASGDAEPMSERFHEAPGGEIEPPAQGLTGITAFSIAPRPGSAGFEEEVWLDPIAVRFGRRLVRAAAGCSMTGVLLALIDAWYAQRAAVSPPAFWQLALACAGLVVPLGLVLAVVVASLSMLLHPDSSPSLFRLPQKLRPSDIRRQARLAVILAVSPLAISGWLLLVARAALPLLGSNAAPPVVGTLLAALSVGFGLLVAAPVLAVARYVGVRLRQNPPDPVRWGQVGVLVGIVPLALAVATGPTSGAGSVFAIFGVFKRPELDLRAPCMLLVIALAGYLLPSRLKSIRLGLLVLVAMLPLGLTVRAATRGLDNRAVALTVERGAPVSRIALGTLRRATDRDHDGFSKYFGGGDCDDHNRGRSPGADDVPENGIDEDCSGTDAAAVTLPTLATPIELLRARRSVIPRDMNVILIIVDTMRADVLHHGKRVTPRLDELAAQAVDLQHAYAPASYTGKSVGPILIGKHSSETNRDFGHFAAFSKKDTFLQQRLQVAGIRTLSVQGYWYFTQPFYGLARGFDVVDSSASVSAGYVEGDRSTTTEKLTERILWQLDQAENTSGRFFLWSQYTDPHAEYVPHTGFDLGNDMLGRYHGEVAFVDYHIGRIIDFVRSKPWGARTAIIVTSDHGEAFGEHGMIRHGFELWEPLVRVPLIFHVPGVEPRQVRSRRSLIDLVPTVLDLMQAEIPEGTGLDFLSGRSLLPELLGIEGSDVPRPLLVDMANGPYTAERQAYIDGDMKLITANGRPIGLFDLSSDPGEKRDLLDNAELRERVVGQYRAYKKAMHIVEVRPKP